MHTHVSGLAGMLAAMFAGTFADPLRTHLRQVLCALLAGGLCEGDSWEDSGGCLQVNASEHTHGMKALVGTVASSGEKLNKAFASDTDKGSCHETTGACRISWPNNR